MKFGELEEEETEAEAERDCIHCQRKYPLSELNAHMMECPHNTMNKQEEKPKVRCKWCERKILKDNIDLHETMCKKNPANQQEEVKEEPKAPSIGLEDLMVNSDEVWDEIKKRKSGMLKNWLTSSHPKSDKCTRTPAIDQLVNIFNALIGMKLKEAKGG